MSPEEVLRHMTRKRIYEHIVDNPGITFPMLRSVFDMNEGTLNYHLDYLRKSDLIDVKKTNNKRCYLPKERKRREAHGLDRMSRRVLEVIRETPGIDREAIETYIDLDGSDIARILSSLKRRRLITAEKKGRRVLYSPISGDEIVDRMMIVLIERYVQGEISFERFNELKEHLERIAR